MASANVSLRVCSHILQPILPKISIQFDASSLVALSDPHHLSTSLSDARLAATPSEAHTLAVAVAVAVPVRRELVLRITATRIANTHRAHRMRAGAAAAAARRVGVVASTADTRVVALT